MSREGPAGSVTVHVPFAAVITSAAGVNRPVSSSGAVSTSTVLPPRGDPSVSPSQPLTAAARPYLTRLFALAFRCGATLLWRTRLRRSKWHVVTPIAL